MGQETHIFNTTGSYIFFNFIKFRNPLLLQILSERSELSLHTGAKTSFLSRNYQEFDVCKIGILWKMRLWKSDFCENWDFEYVTFG